MRSVVREKVSAATLLKSKAADTISNIMNKHDEKKAAIMLNVAKAAGGMRKTGMMGGAM